MAAVDNNRNIISIELIEPYHQDIKRALQQRDVEVRDMTGITDCQIADYVKKHIDTFHEKRLESLGKLRLDDLLLKKNPYLFRSKNLDTVAALIKSLLDASLSSQEESQFGHFLEGLAIHVAGLVRNGFKSAADGIDLEFAENNDRYLISIKSGPHWANSSQIKRMQTEIENAAKTIRQGNLHINVITVEGCVYGRDDEFVKRGYYKFSGQRFWELISGDSNFYTRIVEPLGHRAKKRTADFLRDYAAVQNRFAEEFTQKFCDADRNIDWDKLVRYNSATTPFLALPADGRQISRLSRFEHMLDALRQWEYISLAESVEAIAEDLSVPLNSSLKENHSNLLNSLRGFLMFVGSVRCDAKVDITLTEDSLVRVEWDYTDPRNLVITFDDYDHVSIEGTTNDGKPLKIPKSGKATRKTGVNQLSNQGLLAAIPRVEP